LILMVQTINRNRFYVLVYLQEKYFSKGASRSDVTFYTNLLVLVGMTGALLARGDIQVSQCVCGVVWRGVVWCDMRVC
jgi:hypothetical protein